MNGPESLAARLVESWASSAPHALTKSEYAYAHLRRSILENELTAGTVLDQEPLARELGVSTTPVREALRRLEAEHLVVSRAHRETVVAPVTQAFVDEIYQIRMALDPLAAELATSLATKEQPSRTTGLERFHFSRHLHRAIYGAGGNNRLVGILEQLWDVSDRRRFSVLKSQKAVAASHVPCPAPSHAARRQPGVLGFESAQIDVEDWLRLVVEPMGDYAGSCRMGQPGDPTAVVDGSGRVFGVRGLRVADSSIAPTLVRAAPMLTDVVIGSWISQLINAGISAPGIGKSSH